MSGYKADERFPIVDAEGNLTGSATRAECHGGSMLLHPVVHLHVMNQHGDIYLQKRAMTKDIQPGRWDTAVGGHVDYGETTEEALAREAAEELGLDISELYVRKICSYVFTSERERELVNVYAVTVDSDTQFTPALDEIDCCRFWTVEEIRAALGRGILTPNFESEAQRIGLLR